MIRRSFIVLLILAGCPKIKPPDPAPLSSYPLAERAPLFD